MGSIEHYRIADKIQSIYVKNNKYDDAISFLKTQLIKLQQLERTQSLTYHLMQGKLGILLYKYKKDNCNSLKYLNESIIFLKRINNDKWKEYSAFIHDEKIVCAK